MWAAAARSGSASGPASQARELGEAARPVGRCGEARARLQALGEGFEEPSAHQESVESRCGLPLDLGVEVAVESRAQRRRQNPAPPPPKLASARAPRRLLRSVPRREAPARARARILVGNRAPLAAGFQRPRQRIRRLRAGRRRRDGAPEVFQLRIGRALRRAPPRRLDVGPRAVIGVGFHLRPRGHRPPELAGERVLRIELHRALEGLARRGRGAGARLEDAHADEEIGGLARVVGAGLGGRSEHPRGSRRLSQALEPCRQLSPKLRGLRRRRLEVQGLFGDGRRLVEVAVARGEPAGERGKRRGELFRRLACRARRPRFLHLRAQRSLLGAPAAAARERLRRHRDELLRRGDLRGPLRRRKSGARGRAEGGSIREESYQASPGRLSLRPLGVGAAYSPTGLGTA